MSRITLINNTSGTVRLAIFQKPAWNPTLATIAWQIAAPPPGGTTEIQIPDEFQLRASYSSDPRVPDNLDTSTQPLTFSETSASFSIEAVRGPGGDTAGAAIHRHFTDLYPDEIRVVNNYSIGVEASVMRGDDAIYEPQVIWPGGLFMESVRSNMYVAVISQFTYKGQRLVQEELCLTQTEVIPGDTLVVTGSMWTGYSISIADRPEPQTSVPVVPPPKTEPQITPADTPTVGVAAAPQPPAPAPAPEPAPTSLPRTPAPINEGTMGVAQVPVGSVMPYVGNIVNDVNINPDIGDITLTQLAAMGWMVCDGRQLEMAMYPRLYAALGSRFGGSAGEGTFALPDMSGRVAGNIPVQYIIRAI